MQYGQQKLAQGGSIMLAPQKHIQCKILRPEPLMNSKINPHLGLYTQILLVNLDLQL